MNEIPLWNMAEVTQRSEHPNLLTFLKTMILICLKKLMCTFLKPSDLFPLDFLYGHCQKIKKKSLSFCNYPVGTDLFLTIFLPEKVLIIPFGLHISHSGAHCSCRYLGSIWQSFNYVLYSLWLTTQIIICRDLNFNSGVIRTLTEWGYQNFNWSALELFL